MSEDAVWATEKGELLIFGKRHIAIDAEALCAHLDSLVGVKVAEVIIHNIEFRLGKLDAKRLRAERPKSTLTELVEQLAKTDCLSGAGITKVVLPDNPQDSILIEITNPGLTNTAGAAKEFLLAWWAGALTTLLDKELDLKDVSYDKANNLLKGQIVSR